MRILFVLALFLSIALARELSLKEAMEIALKNSPVIRSANSDLRVKELELKAARGAYFPRIKLEETFSRTDLPAYAFMSRLNQERITLADFNPSRLNNPSGINNFETKLTLEIPIWLGGRIQSAQKMAGHELRAVSFEAKRREEEVLRQVYHAYVDAVLAKEAIKVSEQAVKDASEHLKLAESLNRVGMALVSDVLRAKVYLSKAQENLERSERGYQVAKKAIELAVGVELGEFDVQTMDMCPQVTKDNLREKALQRWDIKAMEERLRTLTQAYRFTLSDNMPQFAGFVQYVLNSKDYPLGADGRGYMLGLSLSWTFDTGLTTLRNAQANLERRTGMEHRIKLMKDGALFEVERFYSEYLNALDMLQSAQRRIEASAETLRIIELRYRNGLARMVDLLDAQTELDKARLEKLQAINACHKAYVDLLFSAGMTEEVKR